MPFIQHQGIPSNADTATFYEKHLVKFIRKWKGKNEAAITRYVGKHAMIHRFLLALKSVHLETLF